MVDLQKSKINEFGKKVQELKKKTNKRFQVTDNNDLEDVIEKNIQIAFKNASKHSELKCISLHETWLVSEYEEYVAIRSIIVEIR